MKNNLIALREERNLTQKELCQMLQKQGFYIARTTYSKYETGSRGMSCEALVEFALFYGVSCDYILGLKDK